MSASQLAFLIIRVLAFLVGLQSLTMIAGIVAMFSIVDSETSYLLSGAYLLTLALISLLAVSMWFKAPYFARKIIPPSISGEEKVSNFSAEDLLRIAIVVIGFYMIAQAINPFSIVSVIFIYSVQTGKEFFLNPKMWESLVESVVLAGLGSYLVFGTKGSALLINNLRGKN